MLVFGICLIILRKRFPSFLIRKNLDEIATPRAKKGRRDLQQLKEMKLEGVLYKTLEIAAIIFGVLLILISISEFFPKTEKYIDSVIVYFMLSLFAAGAASIVELIFIFPFLWKKVRKYTLDRDGILSQNVQNSSGTDKINAAMSGPTDDPVLRALQRKAIIYSIICFVPLFLIVLFAFCTLYILTS